MHRRKREKKQIKLKKKKIEEKVGSVAPFCIKINSKRKTNSGYVADAILVAWKAEVPYIFICI